MAEKSILLAHCERGDSNDLEQMICCGADQYHFALERLNSKLFQFSVSINHFCFIWN